MILPGFPIFFPAAASLPPAISFVGATTSSASTIAWPGGIQAGQLGLLLEVSYNNNSTVPTLVTPSGMSAVGTSQTITSPGGARLSLWSKVLTGSEATLTGMNAANNGKFLMVFGRTSGTWGAAASINHSLVGSGVTTNQTVAVGSAPSVIASIDWDIDEEMDGSMSPAAAGSYSADGQFKASYQIQNVTPSNVSIIRSGGCLALASFYVPLS